MGGFGKERPLFVERSVRRELRLGESIVWGRSEKLTMPKRFSTLRVSIVCSAGTSTRNSECWGVKGMTTENAMEWRGVERRGEDEMVRMRVPYVAVEIGWYLLSDRRCLGDWK